MLGSATQRDRMVTLLAERGIENPAVLRGALQGSQPLQPATDAQQRALHAVAQHQKENAQEKRPRAAENL